MKIHVVVNPTSAAGSTRRKIPQLRQLFEANGASCEIHETQHRGHATELARQAMQAGAELLVAVGGDGTFSEVVQGLPLQAPPSVHRPAVGMVACGTGGDLSRSLGIPAELDAAVLGILRGSTRLIDVGGIEYTDETGRKRQRCFVNVASLGISARVSALVDRHFKWLGGRLAFYTATVCATFSHHNQRIRLHADQHPVYDGPTYVLALANGRYFGGGMQIAPRAQLADGTLDCVLLKDFHLRDALSLSGRIYRGTHLSHPKVQTWRGRRFDVEIGTTPEQPWALDVDGELLSGRGPLQFTLLPRALAVRGPSASSVNP